MLEFQFCVNILKGALEDESISSSEGTAKELFRNRPAEPSYAGG